MRHVPAKHSRCLWLGAIGAGVFALLAACSSGSSFGERRGKSDAKDKKEDEDDEEDESVEADVPTEVSGAFLACAYLTDDGEPGLGATAPLGCGVYKDDQKISPVGRSFTLEVAKDGKPATLPTVPAAITSSWHVVTSFPTIYTTNSRLRLSVTDADKTVRRFELASDKIGANVPLGTVGASTVGTTTPVAGTTTPPDATAPTLESVTAHALWAGGPVGFVLDAVNDHDFCDATGIRHELTDEAQDSVMIVGTDVNGNTVVPVVIKHVTTTLDGSASCFQSFDINYDGSSQGNNYAHETRAGGCLMLRSANTLYIVRKEGAPAAVTLASLRAFAASKACR